MIEDWANVADAEREGLGMLEQGARDYFAGGAGDETTLRENGEAWGRWRLRPRVLTDAGCDSPSRLTRAHLRRAPSASVYSV